MSPPARTFVATDRESGLTVLAALRQWLPGTSWSEVRKLLRDRRILIGGVLCIDETRRLHAGEAVTSSEHAAPKPPTAREVRIVHLDADIVVAEKPAGMITLRHPAERGWSHRKKQAQPAFDEVLSEKIAREHRLPDRGDRPRIDSVHRIDRETSGLLVFARNATARRELVGQFKNHSVERTYRALVLGTIGPCTFDSFLIEDRGDGRRGSTTMKGLGKRAVTHVRPLEKLDRLTLLECRLETGRTHQIRIHLSEAGHPVYGDSKYSSPEELSQRDPSHRHGRMALHAATLGFNHPATGTHMRFESPLPPDFVALLERLR